SYNLEIAQNALAKGRIAEAIEAYDRILELDPENTKVRTAKQEALASLDLAQQLRVGIELFNKGRLRDAERRFRAVLEANPNERVAKEYLDKVREAQERVTSLEDLQKDKKIWQLYVDGLRAMRNRQYQRAIDLWEKVLEVYPNSPDTRNNLKQARLRLQSEQGGQK
ncbi:MAG: tetratricopeptide repeat protein, partial [Candidatus Zixiibacteriota bacterium]